MKIQVEVGKEKINSPQAAVVTIIVAKWNFTFIRLQAIHVEAHLVTSLEGFIMKQMSIAMTKPEAVA